MRARCASKSQRVAASLCRDAMRTLNRNEPEQRTGQEGEQVDSLSARGCEPGRPSACFSAADQMPGYLRLARQHRLLLGRLDRWLLSEVKDELNSRILEVGCGHGNLIAHLLDRDLVVGTDADTEAITDVRDRFRDCSNLRTYVFDVMSPPSVEILKHEIDTVISLNVLEHIEHDAEAVRNMIRVMPAGGTLVIIVPAHPWLHGTMDSSLGHFRRYTKTTMRHLLTAAGAEVTRQNYHNLLGALGWWFSGRVLKCTNPPAGQLSLFDRLVPLLAVAERVIRPPFGLSLITVATA